MKKFALDLVKGNLSFPWVFFILLSFIPIAIFFISWKLDLQNFPMIFGVYMFFASIIVLKTAMKNPNHYAQGLAILLSAVCLFVGGVVILGLLAVLIFSGIDFLSFGTLGEWLVGPDTTGERYIDRIEDYPCLKGDKLGESIPNPEYVGPEVNCEDY